MPKYLERVNLHGECECECECRLSPRFDSISLSHSLFFFLSRVGPRRLKSSSSLSSLSLSLSLFIGRFVVFSRVFFSFVFSIFNPGNVDISRVFSFHLGLFSLSLPLSSSLLFSSSSLVLFSRINVNTRGTGGGEIGGKENNTKKQEKRKKERKKNKKNTREEERRERRRGQTRPRRDATRLSTEDETPLRSGWKCSVFQCTPLSLPSLCRVRDTPTT